MSKPSQSGRWCGLLSRRVARATPASRLGGFGVNRKFLDPRWQQFRLKRLERADWQCEACSDSTSTLHVHHVFYIQGRDPWDYLPESTVVLCDQCHDMEHDFTNSERPSHFGFANWEYAAGNQIQKAFADAKSKFTEPA